MGAGIDSYQNGTGRLFGKIIQLCLALFPMFESGGRCRFRMECVQCDVARQGRIVKTPQEESCRELAGLSSDPTQSCRDTICRGC